MRQHPQRLTLISVRRFFWRHHCRRPRVSAGIGAEFPTQVADTGSLEVCRQHSLQRSLRMIRKSVRIPCDDEYLRRRGISPKFGEHGPCSVGTVASRLGSIHGEDVLAGRPEKLAPNLSHGSVWAVCVHDSCPTYPKAVLTLALIKTHLPVGICHVPHGALLTIPVDRHHATEHFQSGNRFFRAQVAFPDVRGLIMSFTNATD